jgi:hypothetical protein
MPSARIRAVRENQRIIFFYNLGHAEQVRPEPGHPYEQHAITAAKAKTRWRLPHAMVS